MEEGDFGRIATINIKAGEFEMGADTLAASGQLLARLPDAQPRLMHIGRRAVLRFGSAV